jgi:exodeoxyribonuclease VII large subunit
MARWIARAREQVEGLARGLADPRRLVQELTQRLDDCADRLVAARGALFARRREQLVALAAALRTPDQLIVLKRQQLAHALERFGDGLERQATACRHALERAATGLRPRLVADLVARGRQALEAAAGLLESLSYENVLARGFALAMDSAGHAVTSAASVAPGMAMTLQFRDGRVGVHAEGDGAPKPAKRPKDKPGDDGPQGSLL